jgi:hypothetical protein
MEEFDAEELPGDRDPSGEERQAAEATGSEERGA